MSGSDFGITGYDGIFGIRRKGKGIINSGYCDSN